MRMKEIEEVIFFEESDIVVCIDHYFGDDGHTVTEGNEYEVKAFNPEVDHILILNDFEEDIWVPAENFKDLEEYLESLTD